MKKLILFSLIIIAFSCSEEPEVKPAPKTGNSKEEINPILLNDPVPPGYCVVAGGGGYIVVPCKKD